MQARFTSRFTCVIGKRSTVLSASGKKSNRKRKRKREREKEREREREREREKGKRGERVKNETYSSCYTFLS